MDSSPIRALTPTALVPQLSDISFTSLGLSYLTSSPLPNEPNGRGKLTHLQGHVLNEFVRDVAIKYVDDDDPEIREAAALTCCQLYVEDIIVSQTSQHALQVVGEVIGKLLTVGISDPEPTIRRTVLAALDERFDRHLAKAENIRILLLALNDEVFAIREVAISIIGRLAKYNPAYIVPSLRKSLLQMLTELEFSDVARNKEESARLLSLLIQNAQGLIRPYVQPMIAVLLPKASDATASVAATILNAIGELATVGGEDLLPYKDQLMPLIISALQDQSSNAKREAALHALGQLASNSGYVIQPYLEYPELLELLQGIIRSEGHHGLLRQETIKLMGILGALDPYKHQVNSDYHSLVRQPTFATTYADINIIQQSLSEVSDDEEGHDELSDPCTFASIRYPKHSIPLPPIYDGVDGRTPRNLCRCRTNKSLSS